MRRAHRYTYVELLTQKSVTRIVIRGDRTACIHTTFAMQTAFMRMLPVTYMLAFHSLVACVAGSGVAVLPCGEAQLLTSINATNRTFVVTNCWQSETTEVLLRGGVDGVAIVNITLLVSHSVHVRVAVDGVRLVNWTLSLVNVSYRGDCTACAAGGGSVVRLQNASIDGSTVTVSGALVPHDAGRVLLSIEASNVTQSSLALRSSDVGTAAAIESSVITDSNVTLQGIAVHSRQSSGSAAAVLSLRAATFVRTHVTAVQCTFDVSNVTGADHRSGPELSVVLVDNCSLHDTALLLRNVSARVLGLNASSTSRHQLLSVNRSAVAASSVTLTELDSVNVGLFLSSESAWTAGSSVVLDVFRVRSEVAAMPCAAGSFEASTLHEVVAALSAGVVSTGVNSSADVLCVVTCRVDLTVLSAWQLTIGEVQSAGRGASAPGTSSGAYRGVFSIVSSSLQFAQLHLSDLVVNVTSGSALVLSALQSSSSSLSITSSIVTAPRGVRLQHSDLTAAHLHVSSSVVTTASTAMEILNCTAVNLIATLIACNLTAETAVAWSLVSSNVTAGRIAVQRTWLSAASNTFQVQQTALTATHVTLVDCTVTAAVSWAWYLLSSNVTTGSMVVQRTWLSAASNTFQVQQTALTATHVTLVDSNVTAAETWAWVLVSSNVTSGSMVVQRTWLSAAGDTFSLQRTMLIATNVTLVDSSVTAAAATALAMLSSNVTAGSVLVLRCVVTADVSVLGFRGAFLTMSPVAFRWCTIASASVTAVATSGPAVLRVVASTFVSLSLLLEGGSVIRSLRWISGLRVVNSSMSGWNFRVVDVVVQLLDNGGGIDHDDASDVGGMVVFDHSAATAVAVVCRLSTIEGIRTFLQSIHSSVEMEMLVVAEFNISTLDDDSADVSFVRAFGSSTVYIQNVTVDRSRFAGFTTLFGAFAASTIVIVDSAFRCALWSSSATTLRWRPLTKLHLGTATFQTLPVFGSSLSGGDASALCGVATESVSLSATRTALMLSGSSSESPALTASGGTGTYSCSVTTTADATMTHIVAQRVVQVVVRAKLSAAVIGATIAATSFSTVRAGLTAQRIAFVLRSGGRTCGALNDDNIVVEVEDVDWLSSPTRLSVGRGAAAVHRGAVLGNVAVFIGAALLAAAAVGCAGLGWGLRATAAMSRMRLRHVLCVPVMLLLQPTLASSVTLLQVAAGAPSDVAIGAAGVACLVCAVFCAGRLLDPRVARFRARAVPLPRGINLGALVVTLPAAPLQLMSRVWCRWTAASVAWRPRDSGGRFVLDWGFLFDDTCGERHWWVIVDVGVSVAMGGLSSIAPVTSSGCAAWKWAVVAAACCGVVLPVVLVPLSSPRTMCECVAMALLTALVAVLGAVDAGDAVIEGVGILMAVLQWALILLSAVAHVYRLLVRHGLAEETDKFTHVSCMAAEARGSGVVTSCVRDACSDASLPHASTSFGTSSRPPVPEHLSIPLSTSSRMRRQAAALRALVSLICCQQLAQNVAMLQATR